MIHLQLHYLAADDLEIANIAAEFTCSLRQDFMNSVYKQSVESLTEIRIPLLSLSKSVPVVLVYLCLLLLWPSASFTPFSG